MRKRGHCVGGLIILGLAACSPFSPVRVEQPQVYTLTPAHAPVANRPMVNATNATLLVSKPKAHPAFSSKAMIYTQDPHHVQAFSQHQWVDKPAKMLQPLLTQTLAADSAWSSVVASPFAGHSDYRLDTEIIDFHQSFTTEASQFNVTVVAHLIDTHSGRIRASRQFQQSVAAKARNPRAGVMAANEAVDKVLHQLQLFVREPMG